ncbi:Sporulation related domain-containing protein [Loktanella atrilutea]|uniref:Sporulation related domain-containing protein n=1 Tax=Loktanella atrilutea TaxID=366533 RepID=A0A1M4UYU8_LOKAT|nr:SPOR domain-containing protein [Loktanella atrilutea]SHE61803.1 Sporulation related domain-containing protein [Loktanella atrilutea]
MAAFDEVNAPGRLTDVAGRYTQYAGAAVSLTLMIGVAVWGTQTILRDVSGVPVVRAMQGDMRVAPEDPGGDVADHRGLAVNTVAAVGEAAAPEDTLTLAPRTFDLAEEDLETAPLTAATPDPVETAQATAAAPAAPTGPMTADDILALADQISAGITPMAALEPVADEDTESPVMTVDGEEVDGTDIENIDAEDPIALALAEAMNADVAAPAADVPAGGLQSVIRPMARPLRAMPAVATASDLAPAVVTVAAVTPQDTAALVVTDPATPAALPSEALLTDAMPVGTKLVQLGAFPSPADAAQEWDRLVGRFGEVLAAKTRVIEPATTGGSTFYRLRASGFDALEDARAFCETMEAGRTVCTPVVVR